MARLVVVALVVGALLAFGRVHLSKGERLPSPPETMGFAYRTP
jgi:hypothetical protein